MKALLCSPCSKAVSRPLTAQLRDGSDYWIGRTPTRWPFRVFCVRCGRTTMMSAKEFNALPEYQPDQQERDEARAQAERDAIRQYWRDQDAKSQPGSTTPTSVEKPPE